jgi:hypothetical protein
MSLENHLTRHIGRTASVVDGADLAGHADRFIEDGLRDARAGR